MTSRPRVLVVDDEPTLRRALARALVGTFEVLTVEDGAAALGLLATTRVDAVLVDLVMPGMDGAELLRKLKAAHPEVEVVVMAPQADLDAAVAAVRAGAYGLLLKPIEPALASLTLERAVERQQLRARSRALEELAAQDGGYGELLCSSRAMQEVLRKAYGVAPSGAAVLLVGERGTGKELVARAIHRRSRRAARRFVVIDCGAVPWPALEEELLGEEGRQGGLFSAPDAGTVFLDEVGELPPLAQARLLRALTRGEGQRVEARILAATSVELKERVAAGAFREDLYRRLSVVPIRLPPLRQRRDDIPLLANHFLQRCARREGRDVRRVGAEAMRLLRAHLWPGNVRELEIAMEHAVVMARGEAIMPSDLPFDRPAAAPPPSGALLLSPELWEMPYADAKERAVDTFDQAYVERLLPRADGNVSEAARRAGMDRSNFRKLAKRVASRGGKGRSGTDL